MQLIVSDTGVGIPADELDSIFEPFVQLGRGLHSGPEQEGTGLGLSISRDLARGMGATCSWRAHSAGEARSRSRSRGH